MAPATPAKAGDIVIPIVLRGEVPDLDGPGWSYGVLPGTGYGDGTGYGWSAGNGAGTGTGDGSGYSYGCGDSYGYGYGNDSETRSQ